MACKNFVKVRRIEAARALIRLIRMEWWYMFVVVWRSNRSIPQQ